MPMYYTIIHFKYVHKLMASALQKPKYKDFIDLRVPMDGKTFGEALRALLSPSRHDYTQGPGDRVVPGK